MMQEVKLVSETQEVLKGMMEDKIRLQSNGRVLRADFEEMKELEEKKSKEALLLVQKKHLLRYQNERDEAKREQRSGSLL